MKNLVILGSTGSIGTQALEIVDAYSDRLKVTALAAGSNVDRMEEQIRKYHPHFAVMYEEKAAGDLSVRVADLPVTVLAGMEGLQQIASLPEADVVLTAVVGMIGIKPTIEAIKAGKDIALANKETLVTAGHIIMPMAKEKGVSILPVDSEHSAIFQSLNGEPKKRMKKILLTASGGPFRGMDREALFNKTVKEALNHPNWSMGKKITIDSATMVNKGLEVMEAGWLFDVKPEQIQVVVHPQSIIHSMVEYVDGAVMAQLGLPDMKLPIQYALFYPDRLPMDMPGIDFFKLGQITFVEPDLKTFTGLKLAYEAFKTGGTMPTVFNAANEKAVSLFLAGRIRFLQIADLIGEAMGAHGAVKNPSLNEILETEKWCYEFIESRC